MFSGHQLNFHIHINSVKVGVPFTQTDLILRNLTIQFYFLAANDWIGRPGGEGDI